MTSKILKLRKIKHRDGQIENLFDQSTISKIKIWLDGAHDLSYREEDNLDQDLFYRLWIFFNDGRTISISLDYFKKYPIQNCIVIGWHWRLDNTDKETFSKRSTKIKQQFIEPFNDIYKDKSFKTTVEFDGKYINSISVSKELPLENLNESYFFECILDLSFAWGFVMNNFDFQNIQ